jgi:hypothetical protein
MKKLAVTLLIGIMLGYMLGLIHQLTQKQHRDRAAIEQITEEDQWKKN